MIFQYQQRGRSRWDVFYLDEGEALEPTQAPIASLHHTAAEALPWSVDWKPVGGDPGRYQFESWQLAEQFLFLKLHARDSGAPLELAADIDALPAAVV